MKYSRLLLRILIPLLTAVQSSRGADTDVPHIIATPLVEIAINQGAGDLIFEFFVQDKWWLGKGSTVRVPYGVGAVMVAEKEGRIIWDIGFRDPRTGVKRVKYGIVPNGFKQQIPADGSVPDLKIGQVYRVIAYSGGGGEATFVYKGAN
ncbi:MAG: hypothetical protein A3F90_01740 [Deltaproteobacteria bacterium RIFCSPLOWO2_12_FULL_60_19]|nr:MAG: hypothetical protein A3F90_01740 [Deltaproteobacteria bacterium RIFCSPLOWO2_12_FULL_60_19]